jgi:hypothetical protein
MTVSGSGDQTMSAVICQGCGQAFAVPAGYSRNKIQCPGCGVICQVPAGAGADAPAPRSAAKSESPPARAFEEDAAAWLSEPDPAPAPRPRDEPVAAAVPAPPTSALPEPPPRKPAARTFACRRCGRQVERQRECPVCDAEGRDEPLPLEPETAPEPTFPPSSAPVANVAPLSLELDEEPTEWVPGVQEEEDEDPDPYHLADKDKPRCPKCRKDMEFGAVACTSCGFNLRTRRKARRTYAPIAREWETDMTLMTRLAVMGGFWALHLLLMLGALIGGDVWPVIVSWFPLTIILAFVLGTYDRVQILRDERGRVSVIKRWRCFFIPLAPQRHEVRGYEGVLIGGWNDSGIMEWVICISLLCMGCLPALIWWYVAIYQNHYHVALAEDHGRKALTVYRGRSEEQMHDVAKVLCDASGLQVRV